MPWDLSDPFKEFLKLRELFYELFGHSFQETYTDDSPGGVQWAPPVDAYLSGDEFVVEAEIPGVDIDDVDIEFKENRLFFRGKRQAPHGNNFSVHRLESRHGAFERRIELPVTVEPGKIVAKYDEGVLKIRLPLFPGKQPQKIRVEP